MSGQWEVVAKRKKENKKVPPVQEAAKPKQKPNILNGVSLEDVLPKSQVNTLYAGDKNKDNKNKLKAASQPTKKPERKANAKPKEAVKPISFKSIEHALNQVDSDEFHSLFESTKTSYPDAPIVWLKELTNFLNRKITVEINDPVFSNKPPGYPYSVVPSSLKAVIEKSIKEAGKTNIQFYFDVGLTSFVTDLNKGFPTVGYRIILQYIAMSEPKLVLNNLTKYSSLRNSYQNRASIGLAMFWIVGHVGINDIHSGVTVFEELMLPLVEMKNYSQYVLKYAIDLFSRNPDAPMTKDHYFFIVDNVYSSKKLSTSELNEFSNKHRKLKNQVLKNKEEHPELMEFILKKINPNNNKIYQDCLCDLFVTIITGDQNMLATWVKIYTKYVYSSSVVLHYIDKNFNTVGKHIKASVLLELLLKMQKSNEELSSKKRKEQGMSEAVSAIKNLQGKVSCQKKPNRLRKLLRTLFVLGFFGVILEAFYKLHHGTIETSYFYKAKNITTSVVSRVDSEFEARYPEYHRQFTVYSEPYVNLIGDMNKVIFQLGCRLKEVVVTTTNEKYPVVILYVENCFPGLPAQVQNVYNLLSSKIIHFYNLGYEYIPKDISLEQFSSKYREQVLTWSNTTLQKVTDYYQWVYNKIL